MYELNNEIIVKLKSIVNKLEDIIKKRNISTELIRDYHELLKKLENMKIPHIYTREAFDRYIDLYVRLNDLEEILKNKNWSTFEELYNILSELKDNIYSYIDSVKKSYQKELFAFLSPIYIALSMYIISAIIYYTALGVSTIFTLELLLALITIGSIVLSKYSFEASYTVLAGTAIMGIFFTLKYSSKTPYDHYNILLCMAILVISIMNIQASRIIKSKQYQEKIHNALSSLKKITEEIRKARTSEDEDILKIRELEEKALKIFRKLYGEYGEKLLQYKVNILVMHGYKREDALKKIISTYSMEKT